MADEKVSVGNIATALFMQFGFAPNPQGQIAVLEADSNGRVDMSDVSGSPAEF
ncbi:MAG: hypothetical protein LBH18_07915 [Spirochaetaceae bacterium]|jgi:hypothetical protein|nr:hypothetical protein [Spirochaetaceae bacterium]